MRSYLIGEKPWVLDVRSPSGAPVHGIDISQPDSHIAMSENKPNRETGPVTGIVTKTKPRTKKPSMYKVLLLNDDYTPMEFVVYILERLFRMTTEEATRVMLHVHQKGVGVCGVFTYEVAETKVQQVIDLARKNEHPLQCTMEKE
jgi:ATP-dependent Clp protease adaptor protein ClpS